MRLCCDCTLNFNPLQSPQNIKNCIAHQFRVDRLFIRFFSGILNHRLKLQRLRTNLGEQLHNPIEPAMRWTSDQCLRITISPAMPAPLRVHHAAAVDPQPSSLPLSATSLNTRTTIISTHWKTASRHHRHHDSLAITAAAAVVVAATAANDVDKFLHALKLRLH